MSPQPVVVTDCIDVCRDIVEEAQRMVEQAWQAGLVFAAFMLFGLFATLIVVGTRR